MGVELYVKAAPGLRVPREDAPRRYITDDQPVSVPATAYYLRRLHSTLRCGIVYLRQFSAYFAHCKFVDHRFFPFKSIHKYKSLLCSCGRNIFKPELFAKIFILCLLPFIRVECQIVHI